MVISMGFLWFSCDVRFESLLSDMALSMRKIRRLVMASVSDLFPGISSMEIRVSGLLKSEFSNGNDDG